MNDVLALQEMPEFGGSATLDPVRTGQTSNISIFSDCTSMYTSSSSSSSSSI